MTRLATGIHRLRGRSPWEVLWSALASCGLVLFTQLAVAMVPRLFPSLSLLAMLPIAGRWSLSPARSSLGRNVLARRL
jgi:palmitoyltransferase ZDHHC13/17